MNLKTSFIASRSSFARYTNAQIRQTLSGELSAGLAPYRQTIYQQHWIGHVET